MAKRICLLTGYGTNCTDGCYNCGCGGEVALNDYYVPIYNIQRVCDIVKGFTCTSTEGEETAEYIRNELEKMVVVKADVQNISKWISVKDRLPETNTNGIAHILVYDEREGVVKADFLKESANYNIFQISNASTQLYKVTHWQPLPEPPKDGDIDG